jgi:hypothetical protein
MTVSFAFGASLTRNSGLVNYNSTYTVMARVFATTGTFHGTYFSMANTPANSDSFFAAGAEITPYIETSIGSVYVGDVTAPFASAGFNHIAMVRTSATSIKAVVNGVSSTVLTHSTVASRAAATSQFIGNDAGGYVLSNGEAISDFFLYDAALSDEEIRDQMNFAYPRRTANLREWIPLAAGSARNIDFSGNTRDYTETGAINDEDGVLLARPSLLIPRRVAAPPIYYASPLGMLMSNF